MTARLFLFINCKLIRFENPTIVLFNDLTSTRNGKSRCLSGFYHFTNFNPISAEGLFVQFPGIALLLFIIFVLSDGLAVF